MCIGILYIFTFSTVTTYNIMRNINKCVVTLVYLCTHAEDYRSLKGLF